MARTIQEIYNSIIAEKQSMSSLTGLTPDPETAAGFLAALTSGSKVAIWRLMAWVVAYGMNILEVMWDVFKVEITTIVNTAKFGTLGWYVDQAKLFQFGDNITLIDNFAAYAVVDASKRIIAQASATESGGIVFLKTAKDDAGSLAALTSAELAAFVSYVGKIKPAGIQINTTSLNADTFRVTMTIKYDAIIPSTTVLADVKSAIETYLADLPFDAQFRRLAFEDALQLVDGVVGIEISTMQGFQGLVGTTITQNYTAVAGYMEFDDGNSTITMTAA